MISILPRLVVILISVVMYVPAARGQGAEPAPGGLPIITRLLVIESSLRSIRSPLFVDPIEHAVATGAFKPPEEGDVVAAPQATSADVGAPGEPKPAEARIWRWLEAKRSETPEGAPPRADPTDPGTRPVTTPGPERFEDPALVGGYAFATVESPVRRVVMVEALGARHFYVSSTTDAEGKPTGSTQWVPRVGDIYENGLVRVPIVLEAGKTHLLVRAGRGALKVTFAAPPSELFIEDRNATLPTLLTDDPSISTYLGSVVVVNTTEQWKKGLKIRTWDFALGERVVDLPALAPLSITKAPIEISPREFTTRPAGKAGLTAELVDSGKTIASRSFAIEEKSRREKHTRTFKSAIDGSVQYFAVVPPSAEAKPGEKLALILSLHGASVEATNQAGAYAPKDWAWIVCPTNRRPFGFDWEDWGRIDAMEVLAEARRLFDPDPRRLYLTGHSMGGHGTWQLAVTYPGVFAAIAPSAGWPDFWAYTGAAEWPGDDEVRSALRRASAPSRTVELVDRLADTPIYILHGDADDNVPVKMARLMKEKLAGHKDLAYHEQPGAGHWWGNECVDWPALMDFLKARTLPGDGTAAVEWVPISNGGFKKAFEHNVALVYGTKGTPEETAWGLAKTRFDSETFLYRGNASLRIIRDTDFFTTHGADQFDLVAYGNEKTNSLWGWQCDMFALSDKLREPGLGVLAIVPRDHVSWMGLVGGTDLTGMRLTTQLPYFVSGVAYPEWFVIGSDALLTGIRGVRSAGWFSDNP